MQSGALGFFLGSAALAYVLSHPPAPPPVEARHSLEFNHHKHVELGLDCTSCHTNAETGQGAGLPGLEDCQGCHAGAMTESPEEQKLLGLVETQQEPRWRPVSVIANGSVHFSHARHVSGAKIACETCHGAMAERVRPPDVPAFALTMDFCMKCHETRGAGLDCLACHR